MLAVVILVGVVLVVSCLEMLVASWQQDPEQNRQDKAHMLASRRYLPDPRELEDDPWLMRYRPR